MADKSRNEESSYATDEEAVNDSSSDSEKEDNKKDQKKDSLISQQQLELDEEKPQKKKNIFKRCFYSFVPEPGTEGHRSQMGTAGWLRAGVLGANDALVSVASIMVTKIFIFQTGTKTNILIQRWVSQQIPTPPKVLFSLRALRALSPELVPWLLANLYPLVRNAIWNMQILREKNGN